MLCVYSLLGFWTVLMALFPILAITSGSLRLTLPLPLPVPGLMSPLRLLVVVAGDLGRGSHYKIYQHKEVMRRLEV